MASLEPNILSATPAPGASRKAGDVPNAIRRRYQMQGVRVVRFYSNQAKPSARQSPSFRDRGGRLETQSEHPRILRDMALIARARGWTEVELRGGEAFRREAWIALQRQGVAVRGYQLITAAMSERTNGEPQAERAHRQAAAAPAPKAPLDVANRYAVVERIITLYVADNAAREAMLERARARLHRSPDLRTPSEAVQRLKQAHLAAHSGPEPNRHTRRPRGFARTLSGAPADRDADR